jgi:hypothetical protein
LILGRIPDRYLSWPAWSPRAADYAAGGLTLSIPVREQAKPRSIQVTSSDTEQAGTA